ncbi:hypothetical protein [Cerasicoccus frondis]|uniref:hypothetical protein n=1 Tax=Cerasicoccus frondis TaxID=490090 RepID=UPI0028527B98|nr:hypothetical protein [Cerasicoccus frondis]
MADPSTAKIYASISPPVEGYQHPSGRALAELLKKQVPELAVEWAETEATIKLHDSSAPAFTAVATIDADSFELLSTPHLNIAALDRVAGRLARAIGYAYCIIADCGIPLSVYLTPKVFFQDKPIQPSLKPPKLEPIENWRGFLEQRLQHLELERAIPPAPIMQLLDFASDVESASIIRLKTQPGLLRLRLEHQDFVTEMHFNGSFPDGY